MLLDNPEAHKGRGIGVRVGIELNSVSAEQEVVRRYSLQNVSLPYIRSRKLLRRLTAPILLLQAFVHVSGSGTDAHPHSRSNKRHHERRA